MSKIRRHFIRLAANIESNLDEVTLAVRRRLDIDHSLQIVAYRSYGTATSIHIKGRVLKDKGIRKPTEKDTLLHNLISMYKRFTSVEVPNARLNVQFQGKHYPITTDREGYFTLQFSPVSRFNDNDLWQEIDIRLVDAPYSFTEKITSTADVMIPPADAEYGIISDIDDTVVKTSATDLLAMARITFLNNALSRLPFAGVAQFYKSLQLGRNGKRNNPFFYVSSSPWNLYDLLIDFLDLNNIPEGPLLLRDYGLDENPEDDNHTSHKVTEIKKIMLTYPHLKFVLIGDTGQDDPKIYCEIVSLFPDRILAIYIRDVQVAERERIAIDLAKGLAQSKVEMILVDNTVEAAEHAASIGLIYKEAIPEVVVEMKQDKGEIAGKEEVL